MKRQIFTNQQIEQYILGLMTSKEKYLFEQECLVNDQLKNRLQEHQIIINGIEQYHDQNLKNKLQEIHEKSFNKKRFSIAKRRSLLKGLAIAASIAILIIAAFNFENPTISSAEVFAQHYKPYELSLTQRGETTNQIVRAEQLYNTAKYQEVIPIFDSLINQTDTSSQIHLGMGLAKLSLNNPKEAINHFKTILNSTDLLFQDHAVWYTALAYLKLDDLQNAKYFLQLLTKNKNADHHKEAIAISKSLNL